MSPIRMLSCLARLTSIGVWPTTVPVAERGGDDGAVVLVFAAAQDEPLALGRFATATSTWLSFSASPGP